MTKQHQVSGPYESALLGYDLWNCDGVEFLLPSLVPCKGRNTISNTISVINEIENCLSRRVSLNELLPQHSGNVVQIIAIKVFPDLLEDYINQIIVENSVKNLSKARLLIFGIDDFPTHGDFELQIFKTLISNNEIEAHASEEIMGYNVRLIKITASWSRWDVNGKFIRATKGISNSCELVEAIEQIKFRLTNFQSMVDLFICYQQKAIQSISSQLFPELLRQYLKVGMERSIAIGNNVVNHESLIKLVFETQKFDKKNRDDAFHEIVMEINKEFAEKEKEWEIGAYHVVFKGFKGPINTYGMWVVDGKEITLPQAFSPKDAVEYIVEIEKRLTEKRSFAEMAKRHVASIQQISVRFFPAKLETYLKCFAQEAEEILNCELLMKSVFGTVPCFNWVEEFKRLIDNVVAFEYRNQQQRLIEQNRYINLSEDVWKLYYVRGSSTRFVTFDFSKIVQAGIKNEVKYYYKDMFKYRDDYLNAYRHLPTIIKVMSFLAKYPRIVYLADIKQYQIESLLSYLQIEARCHRKNQKGLSVGEISDCFSDCKLLVNFIMENAESIITVAPKKNYFSYVTFYNKSNMQKNTEYIPEEIVEGLLNYIDELSVPYQRMLLIMLNTGRRFKEIVMLEEDCLAPLVNDDEYLKMLYVPWKILQARRDRGLSDYHTLLIEKEVADEIKAQIADTKDARLVWGLKEIFITDFGYKATIYDSNGFCDAVNNLISKHDLRVNGRLWNFESKQCRKTFAVELITNGADPSEVTELLGHLAEETTNRFYSEVRKMKLADMNAEFFRKKFQTLIEPEVLERFTEEERKRLYVDFCLGQRERELGSCAKHYSEGPCSKRTGRIDCAQCEKLCTGPQKLSKWIELKERQQEYVNNLVKGYEREGITEYQDFREFQAEKHLLDLYQSAINKILERFNEENVSGESELFDDKGVS